MTIALYGGTPVRDRPIPYGRQYIDEEDIQAVVAALNSPFLTTGPQVELFEQALCELTGATYAVAISNGTAALHAACAAAKIGPGDEVITTPITFAASANVILYCGATPRFADIDPNTWNISPAAIAEQITPRTRAVIAVDFTGQAVELDEIRALCELHQLILIEDAAHAIGTRYNGKAVGSIADMTTFSFHPVKTITSGEGGAILTSNREHYEALSLFRSHSITRDPKRLTQTPYAGYSEQIGLGYNYRMTDMQAALGVSQLKKLPRFIARRAEIVARYQKAFSKRRELILQQEIAASETARHLYILRLSPETLKVGRDEIYRALNAENIGLQVHYPPVYLHPYYQSLGYQKGLCPQAEALYEDIITLPLFYGMSDQDVEDVITAVYKVLDYYRVE
jgi:perosamine synthetase